MRLIAVSLTVFMLWSANVIAGDTHILLGVDGMSCPFCVYGVEKRLKKIDGVEAVSSDLAQGKIWVEVAGEDTLNEEDARLLLKDAGFTLSGYELHPAGEPDHAAHASEKDD